MGKQGFILFEFNQRTSATFFSSSTITRESCVFVCLCMHACMISKNGQGQDEGKVEKGGKAPKKKGTKKGKRGES